MQAIKTLTLSFTILFLSACASTDDSQSFADSIRQTLLSLNAAENQSLELGIDAKISGIDATHSRDWEGWSNGTHSPSREAERQNEIGLFSLLPDYNRTFDQLIIDPPFASVLWTARGTSAINGFEFYVQGSSFLEFDSSGKVLRSWVHFGNAPTPEDLGVGGT